MGHPSNEPLPPTLKDPSPGPSGRRRRGCLARLIGVLLLLGALAGIGYFLYQRWHRGSCALLHVPQGTNVALRAEGTKLLLFKPVRQHLWPVLLDAAASAGAKPTRRERIERETGVRIPLDVREVIVASVDATSWVAIVGGNFPKGRFVRGIQRVLAEEGLGDWKLEGDVLVHPLGPAIAQAEDGTLLLGTTADVTRAALPAAESEARVPVPTEGALSFLVSRQAWGGAVSLLPLTLPGLDTLMKVEQATGNLVLSDEPRLSVALEPRPGTEAGALARDVESLLGGLRVLALVVPGDLGGAKHALGKATVRAEAGAVRVEAPWPYEALDEAVRRLAELARTGQRAPQAERPAWLPF